jgi:hypothetical protein
MTQSKLCQQLQENSNIGENMEEDYDDFENVDDSTNNDTITEQNNYDIN